MDKCVNVAAYEKHAGDYVKNAYDPKFNVDGKYDEAAASKSEDLNIVLCMEMKQAGTAFKIEKHVHNYPHCWRTDKPVLYYPLDSWFIRTTSAREALMANNETIKWKPQSTGTADLASGLKIFRTGTCHAAAIGAHLCPYGAARTAPRRYASTALKHFTMK